MLKKSKSSKDDVSLGMSNTITRRDFLNTTLLGTGALLMDMSAPLNLFGNSDGLDGYGGVGDYAASHGNTEPVMSAAHGLRDGKYGKLPPDTIDTKETFDYVVVGAGLAGLGAAYEFRKRMKSGQTCLVLDNHPIFGGEAKRNEFVVNGQRLIGPQGSNDFVVPTAETLKAEPDYEVWDDLKIPRSFEWQTWDSKLKPLEFSRENYVFMYWGDRSPNLGWYFDENTFGGQPKWVSDIFERRLDGTPFPSKVREDFMKWRETTESFHKGEDYKAWLDTMSYKQYLEDVMKLSPEVTRYADPILAGAVGLGCDAISAYCAYSVAMPGFRGFDSGLKGFRTSDNPDDDFPTRLRNFSLIGFPGGNSVFARYFVKHLVPSGIEGDHKLEDVFNQNVDFAALDTPNQPVRMRLGSTVVFVQHDGPPESAEQVWIGYLRDGKAYKLRARHVVLAGGNWMNQYVARDLPEDFHQACREFHRSPMLVVNVALNNWRFLYDMGMTGWHWWDGFGFGSNIAQNMVIGKYRPVLHPDKPILMTFYVPFYYPGKPIAAQGMQGRMELLSTSFSDYERQIRKQMVRLFGPAGFDPQKDIAGIILNRWGHAYVDPQPGFYTGKSGRPSNSDLLRKGYGRVAIGHSELQGHQNWIGAVSEGRRAARQLMA